MSKAEQGGAKARGDARIVWSQDARRNSEILDERERARKAGAEKTARLRELRLAREAEAAAHRKPAASPAKAKAKPKTARKSKA
jgi:hypothetical protein